MKYTDKQRVQKIYEYAEKLSAHIIKNNISKEKMIDDYGVCEFFSVNSRKNFTDSN